MDSIFLAIDILCLWSTLLNKEPATRDFTCVMTNGMFKYLPCCLMLVINYITRPWCSFTIQPLAWGFIYFLWLVLNVPLILYGTQYISRMRSKYSMWTFTLASTFQQRGTCQWSKRWCQRMTRAVGTGRGRPINKDDAWLPYWHATAVLPGAGVICMEAWQGHSIKNRPPVPLMNVSLQELTLQQTRQVAAWSPYKALESCCWFGEEWDLEIAWRSDLGSVSSGQMSL